MAVVAGHVPFDFGFKAGHRGTARHQVGDLFAGLFALLEIRRDGAADQDGEVVTHSHGMHDLVGDEDDGEAALFWTKDRILTYREWEKLTPAMLARLESEAAGTEPEDSDEEGEGED